MAACKSLQPILIDKPNLPAENNPTATALLVDTFSPWKAAINSMKPPTATVENCSFAQIFGGLNLNLNQELVVGSTSLSPESSPSSSSSPSPIFADDKDQTEIRAEDNYQPSPRMRRKHYKHSDSFSSMNSEGLSLCTEGLGSESSDDADADHHQDNICLSSSRHNNNNNNNSENICKVQDQSKRKRSSIRRKIAGGGETLFPFPPPISCIGRTGKPWVCFRSHREDGRFILEEIRFPTQEFLHACRQDGRLRLQYIYSSSDDEILEGDEEQEEDDDDDQEVNEDDFVENHHDQD